MINGFGDIDTEVLNGMIREVNAASPLYKPSNIWAKLTQAHVDQVAQIGIADFKRSLNTFYGYDIAQSVEIFLLPAIRKLVGDNPREAIEESREQSDASAHYLALLWDYCSSLAPDIAAKLAEPPLGNPFGIRYGGKFVSQDLAKSIREFAIIRSHADANFLAARNFKVVEIGAGHGRLAHLFAEVLDDIAYHIFDLPPALLIAQEYLAALHGRAAISPFQEGRFTAEEFRARTAGKRFAFFTPNQIEYAPDGAFDLAINVDSFGEMQEASARNYTAHLARITKKNGGHIYYRNLLATSVSRHAGENWAPAAFDLYHPSCEWRLKLHQAYPLHPAYFEAVFAL